MDLWTRFWILIVEYVATAYRFISLIMTYLEIAKSGPFLQSIMMKSFNKEQWRIYVRENVVNKDMQGIRATMVID